MNTFYDKSINEVLDTKIGKLLQIATALLAVSLWAYMFVTKDSPFTAGNGILNIFLYAFLFSNLLTFLLVLRYFFKFVGGRKMMAIAVIVVSVLLFWVYLHVQEVDSVTSLESDIVDNQNLLEPKREYSDSEFNDVLLPVTEERCNLRVATLESGEHKSEEVCKRVRTNVQGIERYYATNEYNYDNHQYEFGGEDPMVFPGGPWNDEHALGSDRFACGAKGCYPEVWLYFVGNRVFASVEGTSVDQVDYEGLYVLNSDGNRWQRIIEANGKDIYLLASGCDIVYRQSGGGLLVNWCEALPN